MKAVLITDGGVSRDMSFTSQAAQTEAAGGKRQVEHCKTNLEMVRLDLIVTN